MKIQENTIIQPTPTDELIKEKERKWRLVLPDDYKGFVKNNNGAIPNDNTFECNGHNYSITRFLCIIKDVQNNPNGWYDISAVESQIGERLTDNEDLVGIEVLPIAELFAGDYLCLDFRSGKDSPSVCVWSHEESEEYAPVTYKVAESFSKSVEEIK